MAHDPIKELKETKLWKYLAILDPEFAEKSVGFVDAISQLLATIKTYFPYYTRHDSNHSYSVVQRMYEIIYPNCLEPGNEISLQRTEVFLLILSAYGHDLGMTLLPSEESILTKRGISQEPGWETESRLQNYLRETHSERGGQYIFENYSSLGVPLNMISHLNLLMKAHNFSISELQDELGRRSLTDSMEIDLMQLASILCIADLLEFSDTRVIDGVIEQLKLSIKESHDDSLLISLRENLKHASIKSNLAIGEDGKIIIEGTFTDPETMNNAYKTVEYMEKWVQAYCDIDFRAKKRRLRLRSDNIATSFYLPSKQFEKLGIRMNKQSVIGLISSNSILTIQSCENTIKRILHFRDIKGCFATFVNRWRNPIRHSMSGNPQFTINIR